MMLREARASGYIQGVDHLKVGVGSGESSLTPSLFCHSWRPSLCPAWAEPWETDVHQNDVLGGQLKGETSEQTDLGTAVRRNSEGHPEVDTEKGALTPLPMGSGKSSPRRSLWFCAWKEA